VVALFRIWVILCAAALLSQHLQKNQQAAPRKEATQEERIYAKLRWLGVEPKTGHLHGEASTTTPASVVRES
jgi:hypothetical protein